MKLDTTANGLQPGDKIVLEVSEVDDAGPKSVVIHTRRGDVAMPKGAKLEVYRAGRAPATAGGELGLAVKDALLAADRDEGVSPEEVAEEVGCSVARVYEVIRATRAARVSRGRYRLSRRGRRPAAA